MIPDEVRAAAVLLREWTFAEAQKMRAAGVSGPGVLMFELVGSVCDYFLGAVKRAAGK